MNIKNLIQTSLIFVLLFTLLSCNNEKLAKIEYSGDGNIYIVINDENVKAPLAIKSGETNDGAIYYETESGKFFLSGKPSELKSTDSEFNAEWILESRTVFISIKKGLSGYDYSFKAEPDSDITGWGISLAATSDEYFTGLFERVVDGVQTESWKKGITTAMNLRGEAVDMLIKPTVSLYRPFYISSNGYGIFTKGTWPGHYDFCKSDPERVKISFEGNKLEGIIYTSAQPAEIVKNHSLNVGPTIVPPEWAFLPWRWRDNHVNKKTYYEGC